ncbi:MAG TPA: hypothetical protein VFH11_11420 [Gemmatimonadota bacterium]|nr:hypothetical protein [Gemmatimonadota bacterium]
MFLFPSAATLAVLWIGVFAIVFEAMLLALGFRLRGWGRAHPRGTPATA